MVKFWLSSCILIFSVQLMAQRTVIYCGNLIDGVNKNATGNATIIVEGNKITQVQKGWPVASNKDKIIDLKNSTVMPGLIDMHVHLESETSPNQYLEKFISSPADYAFKAVVGRRRNELF